MFDTGARTAELWQVVATNAFVRSVTISRVFSDFAVRIPAEGARAAPFRVGQPVEVSPRDAHVLVRSISEPKLTLEKKLAAFDPLRHGGEVMRSAGKAKRFYLDHRMAILLTQSGRRLRQSFRRARLHVTIGRNAMLDKVRSSRDKVRLHRERLRAQGLRPVQIWVPDVRARSFASAARKQSKAVAASKLAKTDQGFIDAITEDIEA
jgi:hypothetical protein